MAARRPRPLFDSPNPSAVPPTADGATFRDLLIFEERLKQNAARLLRRKRKYEVMLGLLCVAIGWLWYHVVLLPKAPPVIRYAQLASLIIALTTLFLFFASGMYSERILAANRFVPQANRALRSFNMYLNTRKPPKTNRLAKYLPVLLGGNGEATVPTTPLNGKTMPSSPLPGSPAATRLVRSSPDPADPASPAPVRRMQIPPIPPSTNPRGEIIFSNKVAGPFREGYERYRNAFERRRKEKLELQEEEARWRIVKWIRRSTRDGKVAGEGGMEAGLMTPTPRARDKMTTPSSLSIPGDVKRSSRPSSIHSEASSAAGSSTGPKRSPNPHRSSGNRGRTDSSASMASNASQSSEASSSGGPGGERKRRSSPKRRAREGTPGSSPSGLRRSLDDEETPKKPSKKKPTMPDASKVAAVADERQDPEATLREPSGDGDDVQDEVTTPVARKTRSSTRLRDEEQAGNASSSSSRNVSDVESEDNRKSLQEGELEISMASLHDSTLGFDKGEQQHSLGKPGDENSATLYPPSSIGNSQGGAEEGAGGWIEVKRTASHLRRAKE